MNELAANCSLGKLSQLQRFILVALCEPRYALLSRREFRRLIKDRYYGKDSPGVRVALSRAMNRLEERDYIVRRAGHWQLTDANPLDNGVAIAFMAWVQKRPLYARCGLKGPPLEALGVQPKTVSPTPNRESPGVEVEFVGLH